MIAFVKGEVVERELDSIVLENQGIGYRILVSNPFNYTLFETVQVYTYQHIREDINMLFGFSNKEEHDLFIRLITVKGIGPKTAMNALSVKGASLIVEAIESGNVTYLKSLPGIGPKAASQIVLDLKGKLVASEHQSEVNDHLLNALEALKSLGYKPSEVNKIEKLLAKESAQSVDAYIKLALQLLSK